MKVRNQILAHHLEPSTGFFACTSLGKQTSHSNAPLFLSLSFLYNTSLNLLFNILAKMGLMMSFAGKGLPTKVIGKVTGKFHEEFVKKNIKDFEDFHLAILEMFTTVNTALPGKHWNVPSHEKIEDCYNRWKLLDEEKKEEEVVKFMKENIKPSKIDKTSLIIGLATPPVAMATKKAGEGVPQLKFIKAVPDVLFVPAATLLALASSKALRIYFHKERDSI